MTDDTNEFAIDVGAEQQAFSAALTPSSIELPATVSSAANQPLPESILYQPTNVNISSQTKAEVSVVALDLRIKFDAEDSYNKLKNVVDDVQQSVSSSIETKWIPDPKAVSGFEERPTLEQTNLIFDNRKERFSQTPRWH
tara:strand:- start:1373 stop:1792 length:420 start_codon:yes stop_codon:yes gene_type:complete